jgi:hypothetical protein
MTNYQQTNLTFQKRDESRALTKGSKIDFRESTVMANIPAPNSSREQFDLTISICSFRRTQHLPQIIERLWNQQTYQGRIQIIVWNNNVERKDTVEEICKKYVLSSTRY